MALEICLLDPLFTEMIQLYEQELEKRGYRPSTIESLLFQIKRIFRSPFGGEQGYSVSKSQGWLQEQRKRLLNGQIKPSYFSQMFTAVEQFNQFCTEGTLVVRVRRLNPMRPLSKPYDSIQQEFLSSLPASLKPTTVRLYEEYSRQFLGYLQEHSISESNAITFSVIEKYLAHASKRHKRSMDKVLRSVKLLLPLLGSDVDISILRPGYKRRAVLPHFSYEEADAILHTVDRSTSMGKRDYAILSVAIYTGLRLGDILNLRLSDIAWRQQEIEVVQEKTGTKIRLPLHIEAGDALADYILNGRPLSTDDHIFVRHHAPYGELTGRIVGKQILDRCFSADESLRKRCAEKTFHAFRRSFGSWLSKEQTPLPLISEMLGHTNQEASKFYLSYNHVDMKKCCLGLDSIPVLREDLI